MSTYTVGQTITLDLQDGLGPFTGTILHVGYAFNAWRGEDTTFVDIDSDDMPIRLTLDEADRYRVEAS